MELGIPHRGGRCRPERTWFSSPVCLIRYMEWSPLRDGTLSSPGGAGSTIYEPQPIRDRLVGGIGDFHTVRGGINPGDISVFVPGLSELQICEWIMILGMDPIVPRWRLLHAQYPTNERPATRQKGHTRNFMFIFSSKTRSSLIFLTTKFLVQCYRVLLTFHRPDESGLQQQVEALI